MSYITFSQISIGADMGSQMQQYASLYAIAKETNKQIVFPESSLHSGWGIRFAQLLDVEVNIVDDASLAYFEPITLDYNKLKEEKVFNLHKEKNYNFVNLFNTHHYWSDKYYEDIFNFKFKGEYLEEAIKIYEKLNLKNTVALHVRRGDYVNSHFGTFYELSNDYYEKAIDIVTNGSYDFNILVFSNDIEWCKNNLTLKQYPNITFMNQNSGYVDLILMSLCDHNIIANSSFSWWAAFYNKNKNKTVVCPTNYIKMEDFSILNGNYYLPTWININNL